MNFSEEDESLKVDGLILAGGQSRRMGEDKAHLKVSGETLLQYHVRVMQPCVDTLYVADNENVDGIESESIEHIKDRFVGSEGPLSGVLAALDRTDADLLWVMSCDNYGLPKMLFFQLKKALLESGADIACLKIDGRHQPLVSVMRGNLDRQLAMYMASGARAVMRWFDCLDVVDVELAADSFWYNINTQEDYQALLASL